MLSGNRSKIRKKGPHDCSIEVRVRDLLGFCVRGKYTPVMPLVAEG